MTHAARQRDFQIEKARSRVLLARVLKFDPSEPRDDTGKWTSGGGSDSDTGDTTAFISPNVGNLDFPGAVAGITSARQEALRKASAEVDTALGKTPVEAHNVVGAWSDGAENSLMLTMPATWTPAQAKVALAMKGWLGDQKSALLFTPDHAGNSFIASFPVKGELADIHKGLLADGLAFHTLEPISGGAMVHVYGDDQATATKVDKAAGQHDVKAQFIAGHGEFIGTTKQDGSDREQRDDARAQYDAIISAAQARPEFGGRDIGKIWQDLRSRWGRELSPQAVAAGVKKPAKKEDFDKAKIKLDLMSSSAQNAFIDKWNAKVGEDPAAFKATFMGGLDGEMALSGSGDKIDVNGKITNNAGHTLGTFTRNIDLAHKSAYSAYFKLERAATKSDIGKKMLAGNVETYQKLGIEKVSVTANIDVGGYAWAKYGYVPTQASWNTLRGELDRKVSGSSGSSGRTSSGMEADSWDMLSSDTQSDVRDRWMRDTYSDFLSSEEQNWRDSGQAKEDAKSGLAHDFHQYDDSIPQWAGDALDAVRQERADAGAPDIPYTNKQLYDAIELSYEGNRGDGEDDPNIDFHDKELMEPAGFEPDQQTLPGIEPEDPSQRLTSDMRDQITKELTTAFDKKAEDDAGDMEPPSYLADSVGEYQDQYWDQKDDSEKLEHAVSYGMADIEVPDDDEEADAEPQAEMPLDTSDPVRDALSSSDPKSIWKVADSPRGKELLLGTSWSGVLNLKDPESLGRFDKYVGRHV